MKTYFTAVVLVAFGCVRVIQAADAGLAELQGKWTTTRTNNEGQVYSMHLDISDPKFAFELRDEAGEKRFVANGRIKTQKAGALRFFTLSDIEAGRSADDLEFVEDERSSVYSVRDGRLIVASNFDRYRDNERPSIDIYTKVDGARAGTASDPAMEKLLGTWDLALQVGGDAIDYELEIRKVDGQLAATLISPRSGRHKFESITYKDGQLRMEIDREIEGQPTRLIYTGKFTQSKLAGRIAVRGNDDFSASWTATK